VGNLVHLGIPDPTPYPVKLRYDRNGFRNASDLDSAAVVAIGDSFVEAVFVPLEETVSERMARALGQPVANLGQSAYGFQQELVVLRRYGLPLEPRLVLWFLFGGNDFRDVAQYDKQRANFGKPVPLPPYRQRSFLRSALFALSRATTRARVSGAAKLQSAQFRRGDGSLDTVYFGQATLEPNAEQWRVGTDTLREAARLTREAGAELLLVYIPRKFEVYLGRVEAPPGSRLHDWRDARVNERVAAWAASEKISFLDTTPALRSEVARGSHPYLLDDVHWNARGHELAAGEILSQLRSRPEWLTTAGE
jgi:lysophospholipase L1-like esterase